MNTIVILCEANQNDVQLIKQVRKLVLASDSQVYLLHVAASDPEFVGYEVGPQHERDWRADDLRNEHRLLQSMAKALRNDGVIAQALLVQGERNGLALKHVNKLKADLVVVGNHQKGLLMRIVNGSTTDNLIHKLNMPLLVIPNLT